MNHTALPSPLVILRVLANRSGSPAGLLIEVAAADEAAAAAPLTLFGDEHFTALAREMTCYYREGTPPELAQALARAGCKLLAAGALLRQDGQLVSAALPAAAVLIEGDWCMAPPTRPSGAQAASRALSLQLAQLVAADAHTHDIEALLRKDPTLSYHLLRLVNSLGIGAGRRITSFSQAILILGRQQLRRWVNLMLFAARQGDHRSAMLLARVAVRGRLLEQLCKARGFDKQMQDQAFIAGMFSLLGVLFGMSLAEVLAPLSMSELVHDALLEHKGELGLMLLLCAAIEEGDKAAVAAQLHALQLDAIRFNRTLAEANHWMLGAIGAQAAPNG